MLMASIYHHLPTNFAFEFVLQPVLVVQLGLQKVLFEVDFVLPLRVLGDVLTVLYIPTCMLFNFFFLPPQKPLLILFLGYPTFSTLTMSLHLHLSSLSYAISFLSIPNRIKQSIEEKTMNSNIH